MKIYFLLVLLSMLSVNCGSFSTKAQTRANANGKVINSNSNIKSAIKLPAIDISSVNFKNYTYPDLLSGKTEKTFTLKNGQFINDNPISGSVYRLRKTYFFDITGDGQEEAVTHILAEGCGEGCDSRNLFYVHSVGNNQLNLIWQIATGMEEMCGLKSVAFKNKKIILELFGNCTIQNSLISANVELKDPLKINTTNYTQFVFSLSENLFSQTSKETLPLQDKNITGYRAQIKFGEKD